MATTSLILMLPYAFCVCAQSASPVTSVAAASKEKANSTVVLPLEKARPLHVPRFRTPPTIDGKLDDEVWKSAIVLKDFYQTQPGDNITPSRPTEVMLGYDSKFFYVAFHAYDEPDKVRATIAKRDHITEDDNVRILLDTFNDRRRAYIFMFNPFGVQQDGILTEGAGEDYSVDVVMESKGIITSDGYTVEVAIPFKSLRYEAGKNKIWGVHAFRRIKRFNNELDSWMPISRSNSSQINQEGHLTGLEDISTERTLELIPSLTISETGKRVRALPLPSSNAPFVPDPGRFVNPPVAFAPGLTAKFGILPTVTLDLAIKPDFAQVEADQTVVTANQRFPIFFEEKRPFFLEGIDIFQTSLFPVHTRAIVAPNVAVKLTGKRGRNTFGLLLASDSAPGNFNDEERLDPNNFRFLDKNAYIGILRLKRDVGKESNLGLIVTSYNFIEKHNQLGGFDGRFRLDPQTVIDFQVLASTSRRFFFDPELGRNIYRSGNGFAYFVNYNKQGRNLTFNLNGQGRTRDYRADVGFTRRTNNNATELFLSYHSDPNPTAKLISWSVFNSTRPNFDFQGRMQNWESESAATVNLRRQSYLGLGLIRGYERVFEEEFGPKRTPTQRGAFFGNDSERSANKTTIYANGGTKPSKTYALDFNVGYNSGVLDFDLGAGPRFPRVSPAALAHPDAPLDPGPGHGLSAFVSFTYQPTNALGATLSYTKSRLARDDNGRVAFDENIFALRATYQFTRFTFARARVDYDTLAANIRGQFLLGWTPNPGTSFYIGYNDDLNRNGTNPFTGQLEPGFRRNGRTFFIKMSYLIRRSF